MQNSPNTKGLWIYAEPITIEKDGEVFDIFFVDTEGVIPDQAISDRQKRLLSIMLSISTFVIYNSKMTS